MLKRLRKLFFKYFDYEITGEYYDTDGNGKYVRKFNRKYYLKCLKKRRGGHR